MEFYALLRNDTMHTYNGFVLQKRCGKYAVFTNITFIDIDELINNVKIEDLICQPFNSFDKLLEWMAVEERGDLSLELINIKEKQ